MWILWKWTPLQIITQKCEQSMKMEINITDASVVGNWLSWLKKKKKIIKET